MRDSDLTGETLVTTDRHAVTLHRLGRFYEPAFALDPDWSPSGSWVTYMRFDQYHGYQVMIVRADGTHTKRLTRTLREGDYFSPVWGPNGHRIAFSTLRSIKTLRRDGTDPRLVLKLRSAGLWGMDWSSRGLLVFQGRLTSGRAGLFTVHPDGSGLRRIISSDTSTANPDWSPNGHRLVYTQVTDPHGLPLGPLWTIRADGSDATSLGVSGSSPAWSPDGTVIAYVSDTDGAIHTVAPDGTGDTVIGTPNANVHIYGLDWRPR